MEGNGSWIELLRGTSTILYVNPSFKSLFVWLLRSFKDRSRKPFPGEWNTNGHGSVKILEGFACTQQQVYYKKAVSWCVSILAWQLISKYVTSCMYWRPVTRNGPPVLSPTGICWRMRQLRAGWSGHRDEHGGLLMAKDFQNVGKENPLKSEWFM